MEKDVQLEKKEKFFTLQIASSWDGIQGDSPHLHTGERLLGEKSLYQIFYRLFFNLASLADAVNSRRPLAGKAPCRSPWPEPLVQRGEPPIGSKINK